MVGLVLAGGVLLATGGVTPQPVLADSVVIGQGDYACTGEGLRGAIGALTAQYPSSAVYVTFDCEDPLIEVTNYVDLVHRSLSAPVVVDGSNGGNPIVLDGGGRMNFFRVFHSALSVSSMTMQNGVSPWWVNETGGYGGAIVVDADGRLDVSGVTFINNSANWNGGAICVCYGGATITQSTFIGNSAYSGGAIYAVALDRDVKISQSSFISNYAEAQGGAVYSGMEIAITSSTFGENTAGNLGSAFAFTDTDGGHADISWSTIIQPDGEDTSALYQSAGTMSLYGVLLGGYGDHCYIQGGEMTDDYTLSNDTSCDLSGDHSTQGVPILAYYRVPNLTWIDGTLRGFYQIDETSPATDAGPEVCDTPFDPDSLSDPDQLGTPRSQYGRCDIGAIEFTGSFLVISSWDISNHTINEGESIIVVAVSTYMATASPKNSIDCDITDNVPSVASGLVECQYLDDGAILGGIIASNGEYTVMALFNVRVNNVAPVLSPLSVNPALVGTNQATTVQMSATDVVGDDVSFTIDCSNGVPSGVVGPVNSETGTFQAGGSCSYASPGMYTISVSATDDDGGESEMRTTTVQVVTPTSLCIDRWSGALRMSESCGRGETLIELPNDGPISLCVNQWNGSTRIASSCTRSEYQLAATGNGSIAICVNTWNGALRVSDTCNRSERSEGL